MQPQPKVNILLVDDRAENLLALEAVLGSLKQNLVRANSGEEALRQLLEQDFAVILLDVQMPGMDGFETAELIRARPKNQTIPIIFITAFSKSDGLVFRGYDAGAVDYLFKPIVPEILRSKVAVFIDLFIKTAEVKRQSEQLAEANRILRTAHDALEMRVVERTAELIKTNEELRLKIIEQRRTEAALRESEGRFRYLADTAPVLIWMSGLDKSCEYFNQPWLNFTGRSLQETGNNWAEGVHTDDYAACLHTYTAACDAHQPFEMEYRRRRFDGEYRWLFDIGVPRFTPEGDFLGYIGSCIDITDRKQAEAKLRESEQRLSLAIEGAGMATWDADMRTGKSLWSEQHFKLLGYEPSPTGEATIEMWRCRVHPEDLEQVMQAMDRAKQERSLYSPEHRNIRADNGQIVWLASFGRFLYDAAGQAVRFIGISFDITDRKQAEEDLYQAKRDLEQRVVERTRELSESNEALKKEILERQQTEMALRQSETRYRAVVEDQTELICRFQPDGTITFANEAYYRYFGLTPQEVIGNRYEPMIFEADRERVAQFVRSVNQENPTVMIENRVVVDGTIAWTQWINRALFNEQGDFIEFQAVGRDITARKQTEAALEESQRSIQKIADTAPVILYVYDLIEERNVYINREITELLGYTPEELQTMPPPLLQSLLHPNDLAQIPERTQQWENVREGEIIQTEYRLRHKNGEWRYFQSQETLFARTYDGLPKQILCAAVDITAAKQLAEVRRAEEQLQASLREKEVLLKEIHHRVKNNLQIVDSLLRLHSRQVENAQVAEILLESQNRIKSIALIHEKLYQSEDLARIEFAEYIPNLVIHLFSSYSINSSAVELKIQVDDISLEIDTAIPCGLIINELVSNALKYAFPDDRKGEIRVEFHADSHQTVTLIVSDNGIGMPAQINPSETHSLGLKLVWGLVEQLEGTIGLDRNQGTRFTITFSGDQA